MKRIDWMLVFTSVGVVVAGALSVVPGCNDTPITTAPGLHVVDYHPWQAYGVSAETPVCRNADFIEVKADEIRCEWDCAHYWTPGDIGPRHVIVGWQRGNDGFWRRYPVGEGTGVGPCGE